MKEKKSLGDGIRHTCKDRDCKHLDTYIKNAISGLEAGEFYGHLVN